MIPLPFFKPFHIIPCSVFIGCCYMHVCVCVYPKYTKELKGFKRLENGTQAKLLGICIHTQNLEENDSYTNLIRR